MFEKRFKSHHDAEQAYRDLLDRGMSNKNELYKYLNDHVEMKQNAIYIHVPFCDKICSFCNLNRYVLNEPKDEYVNSLLLQIKEMGSNKAFRDNKIGAIYFGGGTPTTLNPMHFKQIIEEIKKTFILEPDVEITSETTLHNLTEEHIEMFNNLGINRISIGIQTFQTEGRKFFNRTFTKEEVVAKIKNIKKSFNGIVCIDKIYNYPNETKEMLIDDIKQIIELEIESISFYSLMIHNGSALSKKYDESQFSDEQDLMYHDLFVTELLNTGEYELIELTKIIRKNCDKYKYMSIRNNNGNTIPLGKGAGGKIDMFHIFNVDFDKVMVAKSNKSTEEVAHQIYGLFQKSIFKKDELLGIVGELGENMLTNLNKLISEGYITETDTEWILTNKGLFYGNNIGGLMTRSFLLDMQIQGK